MPMRQLSIFEAFSVEQRRRPPPPVERAAVCYVCHEPTTQTCQCRCRAVVHAVCLLKTVHALGAPRCTICRGPIVNLRVRALSRRLYCIWALLALMAVSVVVFSVLAGLLVGWAAEESDWTEFYVLLSRCGGSIVLSMWASKGFERLLHERDAALRRTEYVYAR